MSNVLCETGSPGKELGARLRSAKGGMCRLAEVMTHATVLLHLHRASPRKCLRGGAPGAAWVAGRKQPGRPKGAMQPRPRARQGTAALRGGTRRGASEERQGRKTADSVSPSGPILPRFRLYALVGYFEGGVLCSAALCGNRGASNL